LGEKNRGASAAPPSWPKRISAGPAP
jgi:hypothetical protein